MKTDNRFFGESGLMEDEYGDMVTAGGTGLDNRTGERVKEYIHPTDKTDPEYWRFNYDPRYCGPDPDDYIEKMVARSIADREQAEIDRLGLHPKFTNPVVKGGRLRFIGIVDRYGRMVMTDEKYSFISYFKCSLAMAQDKKTGKWGFIDRHGNERIPCIWRNVGYLNDYVVCVVDPETNLAGYMDIRGKMVSPCKWEDGWEFHEGLAKVKSGGKTGMIDQNGKLVIPCIWKGLGHCSQSMIAVRNDQDKCGYMNRYTKKIVIECQYKEACMFNEGLAIVQSFENDRLGYINMEGELIIPFIWKKARDFKDGLALVSKSKKFLWWDKWVYINKKGEIVRNA